MRLVLSFNPCKGLVDYQKDSLGNKSKVHKVGKPKCILFQVIALTAVKKTKTLTFKFVKYLLGRFFLDIAVSDYFIF